ncbi:MAG: hypothetical protein ACLUD2_04720 [Clostridium sp.]
MLDAPEMLTEEAKEKYRRCESINANGLNQEVVAALDRAIAKVHQRGTDGAPESERHAV